jgi:glucokinase
MDTVSVLGIDIGGTKTAWAVMDNQGNIAKSGTYATPLEKELFLKTLLKLIKSYDVAAVGIGIAGTVSADHKDVLVCTNIPELSHMELTSYLYENGVQLVALDNDARCALIGEVWHGVAQEMTSAVFLTLGTGVGGAVMQKGVIKAHPLDVTREIGRIVVDSSDVFPASSGAGTVEAFLGGVNLEERLQISMAEEAKKVRAGDKEAIAVWQTIAHFFIKVVRALYDEYRCKAIIIGGIGSRDLEYYLQEQPPCPVLAAQLGEKAGVYGATRIALDLWEDSQKDWDELEEEKGE